MRLPGADERQVISFVQATEQIGLLKLDAEKGALNTSHDRHGAVVLSDVVVAADDLPADREPGQHDQHQQHRCDEHPATGPRPLRNLFRLRHNTFGLIAARVERGGTSCGCVGRGDLVVVAGHRAGKDRLCLAVVVVDDVGDDHRDVVRPTAAQREFDEAIGTFGHIRNMQRVQNRFVADRIGQPVGAQQVAVAGTGLPHDQCRFDLMSGQRPHDQRALRVAVRLLGGDAPLVDQRLDESVVLGDLRELPLAKQISAGVADMHQPKPVAVEQDCGQRGAHAFEFGVGLDMCGDGRVALSDRGVEFGEQVAAGLVIVQMCQRGDHQLGRHLAGRVTTHAVGQCEQACAGIHRVLVVGSDQAAVGARGVTKHECHCAPRVRGVTGAARLPSCRCEPACPMEPVLP